MYAARRATATKSDARKIGLSTTVNSELLAKTVAVAARDAGVSASSVAEAKYVLKTAAPKDGCAAGTGALTPGSQPRMVE